MSVIRKIERQKLKFAYGTNKIQKTWRSNQIDKYSIQGYVEMWNKNHKKMKRITPRTAYNV